MAYRNKEACIQEAERLGIDVSGMSWPDMQKTVSDALKREQLNMPPAIKIEGPAPTSTVTKQGKHEDDLMKDYFGKTILLSPELDSERYRLVKYDEVLGDDFDVEERKFDMDRNTDQVFDMSGGEVDYGNVIDQYHDYTTGTYRLKARKDRKVVALSSVPKENSGMFFRPGIDYATVVTWKGRAGYLWKHWRYPNVRALLIESGYYQDYKHLFKDEPNVWYAAGKQLVCDVHLVHKVFKEIEQRAKEDRLEREAFKKRLGIENERLSQW